MEASSIGNGTKEVKVREIVGDECRGIEEEEEEEAAVLARGILV